MPSNLISKTKIKELASKAAGLDKPEGNPRLKQVMNRLLEDLMVAMDDLDISMDEFWAAIAYIGANAKGNELGLLVPGVALEHFMDLRLDEAERLAGLSGGTKRTIEGPLYVAGAPVHQGEARLDDGTDDGEVLIVEGQVTDTNGKPVAGALVEIWHANTMGFYSFFGPSQSPFNLRGGIKTDKEGRYKFRSIMPSGYGCPPGSETETLLHKMGRHGQRPAHVHYFVSAKGYRQLTTQFNVEGDKYLHDDFAFGTRDELIPPVHRITDPEMLKKAGLNQSYAAITFDMVILADQDGAPKATVAREHAPAA